MTEPSGFSVPSLPSSSGNSSVITDGSGAALVAAKRQRAHAMPAVISSALPITVQSSDEEAQGREPYFVETTVRTQQRVKPRKRSPGQVDQGPSSSSYGPAPRDGHAGTVRSQSSELVVRESQLCDFVPTDEAAVEGSQLCEPAIPASSADGRASAGEQGNALPNKEAKTKRRISPGAQSTLANRSHNSSASSQSTRFVRVMCGKLINDLQAMFDQINTFHTLWWCKGS